MHVRVIPVESGRFVLRDLDIVSERLARIDEGVNCFIAMTFGRDVQAMEVHVDGGWRHDVVATRRGRVCKHGTAAKRG